MNDEAHIDFETGCAAELVGPRSVGVHKYVEDATFRVHLLSWRIGSGVIRRWRPGASDRASGVCVLLDHIQQRKIVIAHNATFERTVWNAMRAKYGLWHWPEIKIEQQRDTMATAMSLNLPASLDMLAKVIGAKQTKDDDGAKLMKLMAKPKKEKDGGLSWPYSTPENLERLGEYCDQDVRTETEIDRLIGKLTPDEQEIWELDQKINDRGIPLDVPLIVRAIDVVEFAKAKAKERIRELTDGAVNNYTEIAKIAAWINAQGVECISFRKSDHDDLLIMSGLQGKQVVEQVINIRRGAGKTSVSKYAKMLECVCADNRARGQFAYHGATQTGRWAGRLIQPQNLVRVDWERDADMITWTLACLSAPLTVPETYDMLALFSGDDKILDMLSKCLRAMVKAEDEHLLYGADFANVEGRVNAWFSGEAWKLDAFRAYDNGTGPDLYKVAYSRSFGVPVEDVGKGTQRQIGKVQELALGYQGGVGAFITMGVTYGVKPHELVKPVLDATKPETWEGVYNEYKSAPDKHGLPIDQWTAIKIIVKSWREAHPNIKAGWYELADAAVTAVDQPGTVVSCYGERVRYVSDKAYLYCQLPDGRVICYPSPTLRYEKTEEIEINDVWYNFDEFLEFELTAWKQAGARTRSRSKHVVYFYGVDPETKQWKQSYLYGGHQCENIVQATSASILRKAMLNVERAGYPIILHAHDEILSHVQKGFGSLKHFEDLMNVDEPWLAGLPLAVKGFEDTRYVK